MPEPTNPRKKSLMPSSPLRRTLRGAGHHLSPIVQVGKEGLTDAVLRQLDDALEHHELVKVKVGTESPEDRFEVAEGLAERAEAQLAQILGRTILVYRRHPERPRFEALPPGARGRAEREPEAKAKASAKPKRSQVSGRSAGRAAPRPTARKRPSPSRAPRRRPRP